MTLDLTINLGNLLTVLSFLVGGIAFAISIKNQVNFISLRLVGVETEVRKLTEILITQGRQDERITDLERRTDFIIKSLSYAPEKV